MMDKYNFDVNYDFKEKYKKFLNMKNQKIEETDLNTSS